MSTTSASHCLTHDRAFPCPECVTESARELAGYLPMNFSGGPFFQPEQYTAEVSRLRSEVSRLVEDNDRLRGERDRLRGQADGLDLDLLAKLYDGTGGTRTGALKRAGFLTWQVTEAGRRALGVPPRFAGAWVDIGGVVHVRLSDDSVISADEAVERGVWDRDGIDSLLRMHHERKRKRPAVEPRPDDEGEGTDEA